MIALVCDQYISVLIKADTLGMIEFSGSHGSVLKSR